MINFHDVSTDSFTGFHSILGFAHERSKVITTFVKLSWKLKNQPKELVVLLHKKKLLKKFSCLRAKLK